MRGNKGKHFTQFGRDVSRVEHFHRRCVLKHTHTHTHEIRRVASILMANRLPYVLCSEASTIEMVTVGGGGGGGDGSLDIATNV